jgi:hypothetical protein
LSGSTITNIDATYSLAGTLTTAGAASGTFVIRHITWDDVGMHYDCTGAQVSWTASGLTARALRDSPAWTSVSAS